MAKLPRADPENLQGRGYSKSGVTFMERPYLYKKTDFSQFISRRPLSLKKKTIGSDRKPSSFEGKRSRDAEGPSYPYIVI